jgi:endogenous inhibitor of DNA gyrase (YacG/DUF329 family)
VPEWQKNNMKCDECQKEIDLEFQQQPKPRIEWVGNRFITSIEKEAGKDFHFCSKKCLVSFLGN